MTKIIGFIAAFALVTFACSSSDDPGSGAGSSDHFCERLCVKDHECDTSVDVQTCRNRCQDDIASSDGKLRADFLSGLSTCYESRDCATLLEGGALGNCAAEVQASLVPSSQAKSFCEGYETTAKKCGGTFSRANCLSLAKTASDAVLQSAEACLTKVCGNVDSCVDATL